MDVFIERINKKTKVDAKDGEALLKKLKLDPNNVLIVRNDTLVTSKTKLSNTDKIKLISVISGG